MATGRDNGHEKIALLFFTDACYRHEGVILIVPQFEGTLWIIVEIEVMRSEIDFFMSGCQAC